MGFFDLNFELGFELCVGFGVCIGIFFKVVEYVNIVLFSFEEEEDVNTVCAVEMDSKRPYWVKVKIRLLNGNYVALVCVVPIFYFY
ncbi:hypothetical protein RIR_jg13051.t1 [Rhizophagus irregularis DAOM 181602=DAOM 197198]|nr:hypothetical protein RIR_jg13051.t1 [Rhizophagus irregularis DAOM 181602=DAOM 197198]